VAARFAVIRADLPDAVVLTIAGPLDAVTAPTCEEIIDKTLSSMAPDRSLVIDLYRLEFIAAAGVRSLFRAADAAREAGVPIRIVVATDQYARTVIDRLDLDAQLPLVEEAGRVDEPVHAYDPQP